MRRTLKRRMRSVNTEDSEILNAREKLPFTDDPVVLGSRVKNWVFNLDTLRSKCSNIHGKISGDMKIYTKIIIEDLDHLITSCYSLKKGGNENLKIRKAMEKLEKNEMELKKSKDNEKILNDRINEMVNVHEAKEFALIDKLSNMEDYKQELLKEIQKLKNERDSYKGNDSYDTRCGN